MKKLLRGFLCLFMLYGGDVFAEESEDVMTTPAAPQGMRGAPLNLPDISVIGDIAGKVTDNKEDEDRNSVHIREIELALQGFLYPRMRADVFLAMHRHGDHVEAEICEAYVSFLQVLGDLSLQVGKPHINFGKINKIHQHHRPYIDQPQVITNFFGAHGLVGEGGNLSYLLPLPFFAQLDVGAWRIEGHHHHHEEEEEPETARVVDVNGDTVTVAVQKEHEHEHKEFGLRDEVYTTRLWLSFPLTDESELEVGMSGAKGRGAHYQEHLDNARVYGVDVTYKLWPSAHSRLIFQSEWLHLEREIPPGTLKRDGFYTLLNYKFDKYWDVGLRYDYAESAWPPLDEAGDESSTSFIITRSLTETTALRAQYKHNSDSENEVYLQIAFGIGPHSHPLE
ncbi:MAG: hypothetical protein QME81_10290 [bacterium]|nr:hypothetical protein [bacterium]